MIVISERLRMRERIIVLTFGRKEGSSSMTELLRNFWIKQSRPWIAVTNELAYRIDSSEAYDLLA